MSDYEVVIIKRYLDKECLECGAKKLYIGLQRDFSRDKKLPIVFMECDNCKWEDTYKVAPYSHQIKLNKLHDMYDE